MARSAGLVKLLLPFILPAHTPPFVPVQYMITPTELVPTGLPVVPEPARSEQLLARPCFQRRSPLVGRPLSACREQSATPPPTCVALCVAASLRLVNPNKANTTAGRLEVLHNGQWGSVCSDTFNDVAATIVCRQVSSGGGVAVR